MSNICTYITYEEAIKSQYAVRHGIDNTPPEEYLIRMKNVGYNVFDPVREWVGGPVYVSSFYRNDEVNRGVGGSKTSQHRIGEAIDIDADVYGGKTNKEIFEYIRDYLEFDQLIWEYGDDNNPAWVHVSLRFQRKNRRDIFRALKENGRYLYKRIA